jgi:hypothetical protein
MKHGIGAIAFSFLVVGWVNVSSCLAGSGTITLGFQIAGSTPTTIYETPGSTFLISVVVTGTGQQMIGVDYHLLGSSSNVFTVMSRNSTTGQFTNPYETDAQVAAGNQVLAPDTSFNLGGNTTNYATLTANGTYEVADYQINVSSSAPVGVKYTLSFSNINSDVLGYDTPAYTEASFSSTGSVFVYTPEPGCVALFVVSLIGLRRNRKRTI